MSKSPFDAVEPRPIEEIAQDVNKFLLTDTGLRYLEALQTEYSSLHIQAENKDLSLERKGMLIERAAGVKWCIDWLAQRSDNFERGIYSKKKTG